VTDSHEIIVPRSLNNRLLATPQKVKVLKYSMRPGREHRLWGLGKDNYVSQFSFRLPPPRGKISGHTPE